MRTLQGKLDQERVEKTESVAKLSEVINSLKQKYEQADQEAKAQVGELDKMKDNAFKQREQSQDQMAVLEKEMQKKA